MDINNLILETKLKKEESLKELQMTENQPCMHTICVECDAMHKENNAKREILMQKVNQYDEFLNSLKSL